ncbi:UNVERIFIED_CONTAM: Peroxidase 64 [Sesamum latifolium]|uniref:Peroxidase n=1 Tax=Sesamum latifolium TaxID=2727402 RepID=A0AAW2VC93_9LAMI
MGLMQVAALLCSLTILSFTSLSNSLSSNYYHKSCPKVESIVAKVVSDATSRDRTVPAALLRMHFHDCFIRAQKRAVEAVCPGIVSCADILAFAARDSVVLSGGPRWDVPKGRKDGRTSRATETALLPSPAFNISQLQKSFSLRGLSLHDLVALTGAHTLGFSHCSSFQNRIHNFNSTHDVDPTLRPSFAASLKSICPIKNKAKNAGITMDPSSTTFDNTHYKLILQRKTLFSSDQALLTTPYTKTLVYKFATSKKAFHTAFAKSMIKLSSINGGQEVRRDCRFVN